jgi:hypothetical protein
MLPIFKMKIPPVFMLSTPKNLKKPEALASIAQLNKMGFKTIIPFQGVVRSTDRSKIVMDGWKKFFTMLQTKSLSAGLLIAEDDLYWEDTWEKMKGRMKMDKINWLCYQKFFKEKQRDGTIKEIPVGNQLMYIPKQMIEKYAKDLMAAKSIHFDRWNSRQPYIHYAYKPHEVCAEMEHVSGTTAKVRAGAKLQTYSLPTELVFTGKQINKFAGIPVLKFFDEAKRIDRQRQLKATLAGTKGDFVGINPKTGKKKFKITRNIDIKVKKINYKTK